MVCLCVCLFIKSSIILWDENFNTATFKQVTFGRLQNFDLSNSSQWQALSAAIIHTAQHLLEFCWCFCATVAQKSPQKKRKHNTNSTGMSVNLVVCACGFILIRSPKGQGSAYEAHQFSSWRWNLRQHRIIPALRLKHRSGGCGTASALPKCSIRHPVLSALLA